MYETSRQRTYQRRINVDQLLRDEVGGIGQWQLMVAILSALGTTSISTFPVFANSASRHRCLMPMELEDTFNERKLTFDEVSQLIGPWPTNNISNGKAPPEGYGCVRYKKNWNSTEPFLIVPADTPTEKCSDGYVHEDSPLHYPGNVVKQFATVCGHAWMVPLGTSVYMLGMLVGFTLGGIMGDRCGRKFTILTATFLEVLAGLSATVSPSYTAYVLSRGIMAIANTAKICVIHILVIELTLAQYRSTFSAVLSITHNCIYRAMMSGLAFYIPQWRLLLIALLFPNVICILHIYFIPESPRWLLSQGRTFEALRVLKEGVQLNRHSLQMKPTPMIDQLINDTKLSTKINLTQKTTVNHSKISFCSSLLRPLSTRYLIKTTILSSLLMCMAVFCYFGILLYARTVRSSVYLVTLINAITALPGTIIFTLVFHIFPRRRAPLIVSCGMTAIALLIGSIYAVIVRPTNDLFITICSNIALVLLSTVLCMYYVYIPELYPCDMRTQGFGTVSGIARIGSVVCTYVNQMDVYIMHGTPLLFYGAAMLLSTGLLFMLTDTSGENLTALMHQASKEDTTLELFTTPDDVDEVDS